MTDTKQRLREIRKSCDLGPLKTAEDLGKYWLDTDNARDALYSVRESLRDLLEDREDREDVKILFCGHGGTGKSTELNKLVQELVWCVSSRWLFHPPRNEPCRCQRRRPDFGIDGALGRRCAGKKPVRR